MKAKTRRELAFIKDFYLPEEWTEKFTSAIEEHLTFPTKGNLLYLEAGTGNHVFELREKLKEKVDIYAVENDAENLRIAEAKAQTLRAKINFQKFPSHQTGFSDHDFNMVLGDFSLVAREDLPEIVKEMYRVAEKKATVAFFLPTAGSYGEFFSIFWEALFNADLAEYGANIEGLILNQTRVSEIEEVAELAGLQEVESFTTDHLFDFETGKDFSTSPLIENILLPFWMADLPKELRPKAIRSLVKMIDAERDGMSFQLSLKATLVVGKK